MWWVTALLVVSSVAIIVPAPRPCQIFGTPRDDIRTGDRRSDVICLKAGKDYGHGRQGPDSVRGGPGRDSLVGGAGKDVVFGRAGSDHIFVVDGVKGNDTGFGGRGFDRCYGDRQDRFRACERIFRGNSYPKAMVLALIAMLGQSMALGEEAQLAVQEVCGGHPSPPPICEGG
jgi:RTX calcium-binding nonapeptide repeat (4 copies)